MKVYLVTTGSYSDYGVQAVFTDRALAEAHREAIAGNDLEEYEVVDHAPRQVTVYSMSNDTYEGRGVVKEWTYLVWDYYLPKRIEVTEYDRGSFHAVRVAGLDKEAVAQTFRDRLARYQATQAGIS